MFLINGVPGRLVPCAGTLGVRAADIATGGTDPSPLANDFTFPADNDTEFLWVLKTPLVDGTSGGTTTADDAGGYLHTGAADGSYSQGYRVLAVPQSGAADTQDGTINFTVGAALKALVLSAGALLAKAAPAGGDLKLYLTAAGAQVAKTAPGTGDRLLSLDAAGAWHAGAAA